MGSSSDERMWAAVRVQLVLVRVLPPLPTCAAWLSCSLEHSECVPMQSIRKVNVKVPRIGVNEY